MEAGPRLDTRHLSSVIGSASRPPGPGGSRGLRKGVGGRGGELAGPDGLYQAQEVTEGTGGFSGGRGVGEEASLWLSCLPCPCF